MPHAQGQAPHGRVWSRSVLRRRARLHPGVRSDSSRLMLPNKNGYEVCRDLRRLGLATPILMLTAQDQTMDKVLGLKIGADRDAGAPRPGGGVAETRQPHTPVGLARLPVRFDQSGFYAILRHGQAAEFSAKEFQPLRCLIRSRKRDAEPGSPSPGGLGLGLSPLDLNRGRSHAWLRQKPEMDPDRPRTWL